MEILDLSLLDIVLAILAVAVGTAIQTGVGFGLALVSAPLLLLINRNLVPGPLIATALCLVLWMTWQDRHALDLAHFKVAIAGRIAGTPPAAYLMSVVSAGTFDLLFGSLVLLAVAISLVHRNIRPTPLNVFIATFTAGFMSTISSIGGPPQALVYQNAQGAYLRANLSMLFSMGCVVSLTALSIIGRFHLRDLGYCLILLVGVVIGYSCSGPLKRMIDKQTARPWLLGLCFVSGVMVVGRALIQG